LEETGLLRVEASGASSNPDIIRSNCTILGWGFSLLLINDFFDLRKISITEDNSSVPL